MEHHRRREERIEKGGDFYIQRQHRWHAMSKGENRERKEIFSDKKRSNKKGDFYTKRQATRKERHRSSVSLCCMHCIAMAGVLCMSWIIHLLLIPCSLPIHHPAYTSQQKWYLHCNLCLILVKANIFSIHPLSSSSQHTLVHLSARISQNNFSKLSAQIMPCFLYLAI